MPPSGTRKAQTCGIHTRSDGGEGRQSPSGSEDGVASNIVTMMPPNIEAPHTPVRRQMISFFLNLEKHLKLVFRGTKKQDLFGIDCFV